MPNINYAKLDVPANTGSILNRLFCPVCGKLIHCFYELCDHVAFIFDGAHNNFEYQSEEFKEKITDLFVEISSENLEDILIKVGYDASFLALDISRYHADCGAPTVENVVVGIDYSKE